jgi:hypothetical protein
LFEVIDVPKRLQKDDGSKRKRKQVERFTEDETPTASAPKEIKIKKGKGKKLEDCENGTRSIRDSNRGNVLAPKTQLCDTFLKNGCRVLSTDPVESTLQPFLRNVSQS